MLCTFWGLCCAAAHRGLHLSVLSSGSWRGRARAYSCEVRGAYLNAWLIYLILGCIYSNTATQQHSNTQHGNTSRALTPETLNPRGAKSHQHTIHGKGAGIFFYIFALAMCDLHTIPYSQRSFHGGFRRGSLLTAFCDRMCDRALACPWARRSSRIRALEADTQGKSSGLEVWQSTMFLSGRETTGPLLADASLLSEICEERAMMSLPLPLLLLELFFRGSCSLIGFARGLCAFRRSCTCLWISFSFFERPPWLRGTPQGPGFWKESARTPSFSASTRALSRRFS